MTVDRLSQQNNSIALVSQQSTKAISESAPMRRVGISEIETPPITAAHSKRVDETTTALVRWSSLARELVAKTKTNPLVASRMYAMLALAQHRALEACASDGTSNDRAAVAAASEVILKAAFPSEATAIDAASERERSSGRTLIGQGSPRTGRRIGEEIAREVIESRKADGHDAVWNGQVPEASTGIWRSSLEPPKPPLLPAWGDVKPFFMPEKGAADRPRVPPPPAHGSPEYAEALAEVRRISDTRTEEQLAIALHWADNAGTPTPPGHWNQIACDHLLREKKSPREAAKILAAMSAAMGDAVIACWESKYDHWLIRPSQDDPNIVVPEKLGLPNFPSYVSGHASCSGAAAAVLAHFFPEHAEKLTAMAEEATMSRVYGGIHFRFDGTAGLELGRKVARFSIDAFA